MAEASIGLADAVKALRAELNVAIKRAAGEAVRFEMGEVEMEFLVAIEKTEGADAGIRFWVVSIGAHADHQSSSSHRILLHLTPKVDGRPAEIADEVLHQPEGPTDLTAHKIPPPGFGE